MILSSPNSHFAIILAAGNSTRMGICKTSLPWCGGETLLNYQIKQWLEVGFTPVVVLGSHNAEIRKHCPHGCIIVINPNANYGKTTSILAGLEHTPNDLKMLAISAVDQPRKSEIYQRLIKAHQDNFAPITAPTYQGRMGHPLLFGNGMRSHLWKIREETLGLRQIMRDFSHLICQIEFDAPTILLDINTPEIYRKYFYQTTQF